jgi:hypothetical protein
MLRGSVSSDPSKIPYGGFSPVRLQGSARVRVRGRIREHVEDAAGAPVGGGAAGRSQRRPWYMFGVPRRDGGSRMSTIKPIFLLADSHLLFWRDQDGLFLARARALLDAAEEAAERDGRAPRAAYLGASNGDAPEFYDLFRAAMEQIGIADCCQIPSRPAAQDLERLTGADLILLAGGSVEAGWRAFKEAGLDQRLVERYYGGALLIGISAGAVQLGLKGWDDAGGQALDMLRIVPFVIDAHDEPGWGRLQAAVRQAGEHGRGLGIPSGGGALYHPDYSIEPIRQAVTEVEQTENGVRQSLLLPGEISAVAAAASAGGAPSAASHPGGGEPADDGKQGGGEATAGGPYEATAGGPVEATAGGPDGAAAGRPDGTAAGGPDGAAARERAALGYSIRADGIIDLHPETDTGDPVN